MKRRLLKVDECDKEEEEGLIAVCKSFVAGSITASPSAQLFHSSRADGVSWGVYFGATWGHLGGSTTTLHAIKTIAAIFVCRAVTNTRASRVRFHSHSKTRPIWPDHRPICLHAPNSTYSIETIETYNVTTICSSFGSAAHPTTAVRAIMKIPKLVLSRDLKRTHAKIFPTFLGSSIRAALFPSINYES